MRYMLHPYHPRQPMAMASRVHSSDRRGVRSPCIGLDSRAARQIALAGACRETLAARRPNFDPNRVKLDLLGGIGRFVADGVALSNVSRDFLKRTSDRFDVGRLERDAAARAGELAQTFRVGVFANWIGDRDGIDDDVRCLRLSEDGVEGRRACV